RPNHSPGPTMSPERRRPRISMSIPRHASRGPREIDDFAGCEYHDPELHRRVLSSVWRSKRKSSITWLASSRSHISSTLCRASRSSAASRVTSMYLPTRTSSTSRKPSEARPCLTVTPCGSLTTALGVTITRAVVFIYLFLVPGFGRKQRFADQSVIRGEVALAGLGDDVVGKARRIRFLVPTRARQPVSHELLVV